MPKKAVSKVPSQKRAKISQSDIPGVSLEQSLRIAHGIWENFAGKGAAPHHVAMALDLSPTSGSWRMLCGASIAYGLTDGGCNAKEMLLTELGRRIVAPTVEGDDLKALQQAALIPRVPGEFFKQYDRAKFPRDDIAANVLVEKGIPKNRADALVNLIKENGYLVGFIKDTKAGPFVSLDVHPDHTLQKTPVDDLQAEDNDNVEQFEIPERQPNQSVDFLMQEGSNADDKDGRVFISHGKNKSILEQIKEVVELGGFEPVVSVQIETAAKPVPEKVMDDMRRCGAAVIHVGSEGILKDDDGDEHPQINPNVLIEIGAAMALYGSRFILIVEEGVKLPSNLQGLYESRYKGNAIEFQAGMRILKALRGLKEKAA